MAIRASEGGAFRHVADLSHALAADGYEVSVCGPHETTAPQLNVPMIPLAMSRAIMPGPDSRAALGFARIVRDFQPDLIHAHGNKAGVIARLAHVANPGVPVIYSPHGYAFAGHFTAREQMLYRTLESAVAPLATRILCVCEAEARLARAAGLLRPRPRLRVVHNGIAPYEPVEGDPAFAGAGPMICATSGLRPGKGLDTLLEAMIEVRDAVPGARLALAGDGPERAYLDAVATCNGVADTVQWLGNLTDVNPLLASSDVFVNPSWSESFPYSVLEAMAVGCPIVATDVGGVSEAVEHDETGLLVPAHDRGALAAALIALLHDRGRASDLGTAARERQRTRFTLERMVAGIVGVYDGVLGSS